MSLRSGPKPLTDKAQSLYEDVLLKAEAAKSRLAMAEKEADIAQAELSGMQKLLQTDENSDDSDRLLQPLNIQRTQQFVDDQTTYQNQRPQQTSSLNPEAKPYLPQHTPPDQWGLCSELSKFLLKRDLLISRLSKFNDNPECFAVWKSSFTRIMEELDVTPLEEVDLLIKWLGPDSSRQAMSIRAANTHNPDEGLQRIWERLDDRYASPELIEATLKAKLNAFPKLTAKDHIKLYDLSDIVSEIESMKNNDTYASLLAYYDSSVGVTPIVNKLPHNLQERWVNEAVTYKERYRVPYPPFSVFASFLRRQAKIRNDPSFFYQNSSELLKKPVPSTSTRQEHRVFTKKTDASDVWLCPFHDQSEGHTLNYCKAFRRVPLAERKVFLQEHSICFRCCSSTSHIARDCKCKVQCFFCKSDKHPTALHVTENQTSDTSVNNRFSSKNQRDNKSSNPSTENGGESKPISTACTQVCDSFPGGKSCAKTVLVKVFHKDNPEQSLLTYAVLDDQSNRSLARTELFDTFNEHGNEIEYSLTSCAGSVTFCGRRASGYVVQSLDESSTLDLPTFIECNNIPDMRDEIPTPEAASYHPHLSDISTSIPPINPDAKILLLIGRDLPSAHHVLEQRTGPLNSPYAQKLNLGWTIIGEVCLGKVHKTDSVTVNKVYLLSDGRATTMKPCPNNFELKDSYGGVGDNVFQKTEHDEVPALSVEDKKFLNIMDAEFSKDTDGNWIAPLPFRPNRPRLPCNKSQALHRAKLLDTSLQKNPIKKDHMVTFMKKVIDKGHAEIAPPLQDGQECWYLPLFGVYNSKKPGQIRAVFDSSAKYQDISLNSVLMTGPDLTNSLLGILLRFRTETIAVTADVEQMFYCFKVREDHRDYLRFLWYRDNDPGKDLIEYRMTSHVFGNSPSPAVATYGLRKSVEDAEEDVRNFVENDFYVDDALLSASSEQTAIDLMQKTQKALKDGGNLRLHKIASNSANVLSAFAQEDLAKDIKDIDLLNDTPPLQRSLGMCWDLATDTFTFQVSSEVKPFTRRGVLSTLNSLYDPIGFMAPVVIRGKLLLRNLMSTTTGWDEPLPDEYLSEWQTWCDSLQTLESVYIPRHIGHSQSCTTEVHIFSDASKDAIGAAAYIKIFDVRGRSTVSFALGKAKVAPVHGHTIPRLELCAAVLSAEMADILLQQLHLQRDCLKFYTDSKVVLGYIYNEKRRFHVYVANRVDRIRRSSQPEQWNYVSTDCNPADLATRSVSAHHIANSLWLKGPDFLLSDDETCVSETFSLVQPDSDKEVRPKIIASKTSVNDAHLVSLGSERFERFSSWKRLVKTISHLRHISRSFCKHREACSGWHQCGVFKHVADYDEAELFIIKTVQHECYPEEIERLLHGKPLPQTSSILPLSPALDEQGVLRVGGRLNRGELSVREKNPIIIPKKSHISTLLVRHVHEKVKHQGRHLTEGAVRSSGYWIVGAKRLVSSIISKCVLCRRLRRNPESQKMSDLPPERLAPCPPFTYVGLDTFGPWDVVTRRTRGGSSNSKRWAILFTCLVTRAVHIDIVEEMTSSSFINCLRRFVAVRGEVKQFRSDRGTNFIGATDSLHINAINVEDEMVREFLYDNSTTWIFNTPYSSHMGGVWERMIGIARRILDSMLLKNCKPLTHEVLSTFMCEVTAIMNARPITTISTDSEQPLILSPSALLTQKNSHVPSFCSALTVDVKDMYKSQWRHVQVLAEQFWKRWRVEYLQHLQVRTKWRQSRPNLKEGDLVLVKDKLCVRNEWPLGVIETVYAGQDGLVRKVSVRVYKDNKCLVYTRPITNLVLLM